jgi:flagellar hook assembly protein FlgD
MSGISQIQSASDIQLDYMKILVSQLQNQDPLEPMDNNQMTSQLTQLAQLGQTELMGSSFAEVLKMSQRSYANSLLDKSVTFFHEDASTGVLLKRTGRVDSVFNDPDSKETLLGVTSGDGETVQEFTLGLDAVILVEN